MHVAFTRMKSVLTGTLFFIVFRCVEMKVFYSTYPHQISRATPYDPRVVLRSCFLKPDPGPCRGNITMYYLNPEKLECKTFNWGGCQGNGNRFNSEEECTGMCLNKPNEKAKRPRACNLSYDYGFCFGSESRWYYDHMWKVCKETIYSGCGGNKNNFYDKEQCDSICRLGNGPIFRANEKDSSGLKKILIINPPNAAPSRGKHQSVITTTFATSSNTTVST